ncbi:MAG: hypothetical protein L0211_11885 [Planctomycetaceae bacterium]|nr:hypothetical protein [Planctomycetaceae bacterium]
MKPISTKLPLRTWIAAALTILVPLAAAVAQRPELRRGRPRPDEERQTAAELTDTLAQAQGLLFVDGEYIPLPLTMRIEDGRLVVNDRPVLCRSVNEADHPRSWRPAPQQLARNLGLEIATQLTVPQVVVSLPDQPLVVIADPASQCELLCKLAGLEAVAGARPVALRDQLPSDLDVGLWDQWIADFAPTPEFVTRVSAYVEVFARAQRESEAALAATRRLHDFSYPLTLAGMVAAVLGFGHLLSHRPPVGAKSLDTDASPLALRVLNWSLVLVVAYSALDLAWTILAGQAGQMLELNPLGSRLIEDPLKLIAFKAGATAISVGLLFYLRKYCKAQLAAWWICLILTLLTARWLMMSSMFVA